VLGQHFDVVPEGLDPQQVAEFLESVAGSSDAAFKRLEQFVAFQTLATTMNDSITEARDLAERAKAQASLEAEQKKSRAIGEAGREVGELLTQVKQSCLDSLDRTFSTLEETLLKARDAEALSLEKASETVAKARELERRALEKAEETSHQARGFEKAAFEKAIDTMSSRLADIGRTFQQEVDARISGAVGAARDAGAVESADDAPAPVVALEAEALPSLAPDEAPVGYDAEAHLPSLLETEDAREADVEDEVLAPDADNTQLYSGSVTVRVPGGVDEPWAKQLRQAIATVPGARIREESGDDDGAFTVSLVLEAPAALLPALAGLPEVVRVVEKRSINAPGRQSSRFRPGGVASQEQTTLVVEMADGAGAGQDS
jgi:hypothetical protein